MPQSLDKAVMQFKDRFVDGVYKQGIKIKDLDDFKNALFLYMDSDNGERASRYFDDEIIRTLFLSDENREQMKKNLSEKEFNQMFTSIERSDSEIIREKPIGKPIKAKEVKIWVVKKEKKVNRHFRKGNLVKDYPRSKPMRWKKSQINFIRIRKVQKLPPKQIAKEYNEHFIGEERSISSVTTKLYRI
jgi:hypothetical protein